MEKLIKDIEPFLTLIAAVFSVSVLGFLIRLTLLVKETLAQRIEAIKDQKGVVEERLKMTEDDLGRTEKWYQTEVTRLKEQLSSVLNKEGISIEKLSSHEGYIDLHEDIKQTIRSTLKDMRNLEDKARKKENIEVEDPEWYLEKAKAFSLSEDWLSAARNYDKSVEFNSSNWEVHFLRAIAYANSRQGEKTNFEALRALNEAIAFAPKNLDMNLRARLHGYRGSDLKRLSRLDEAESDLILAKKWARNEEEVNDISYNLACVYAMKKEKQKMLESLNQLKYNDGWKGYIRTRREYFNNYWDDSDFRAIVFA